MKKEKEGTPKRKGMENGSFRYTLILSYLFVFVSNNFLRRWFIPNMNLSSMIGFSCVLSAFFAAFPTWRNGIFVTASTDAVLLGFHLFFVFPALLWCVFRHLYRPLFLRTLRVHFLHRLLTFHIHPPRSPQHRRHNPPYQPSCPYVLGFPWPCRFSATPSCSPHPQGRFPGRFPDMPSTNQR